MAQNKQKVNIIPYKEDFKLYSTDLVPYQRLVDDIKKIELRDMEDNLLKEMSKNLMIQAQQGTSLDELMIQAYALVRETIRRVLGLNPFDVQILAAVVIHKGKLVEMQTGEGKTLVSVFPAYLSALEGKGMHILTANDYLARRDAGWMGPVYNFLGLTTGFVNEWMGKDERKKAYNADITYITAKEVGFDYLRDSLCFDVDELVQRTFNFAIVDEADFTLIDEARIPLVIAENTPSTQKVSSKISKIVNKLKFGVDYDTDEYSRNVFLTETGTNRVEEMLGCKNIYDLENYDLLLEINCAIHAQTLLRRDVDYIVQNGKVELVDEFTGRIADKRVWPNGLQTAIESKEGLETASNGRILSSITVQFLLKSYPKMCGMSATAKTSAYEFKRLYDLDVVVIPPNRPCIRKDEEDFIFTHSEAKYKALISEIKKVHASGRPVLIGTASIKESEELAKVLKEAGVNSSVLNAKNDELEAGIIAQAGVIGAVTVSTNMAGRGTDIRLGGIHGEEREKVVALGGLYVIGTNKHESRRIDNQLRGRSGRQGDPGSSRFFISLEDDLFKRYGTGKLISKKKTLNQQDGPINNSVYTREVERVQLFAEGQNEDIRDLLWRYSYIVEDQRKIIYKRRQQILLDRSDKSLLSSMVPEEYNIALSYVGTNTLKRVEKYISLFCINQCWAEYIDQINYIRDGIHLVNVGGKNPLEEFCRNTVDAFQELTQRIDVQIIDTFKSVDFSHGDVDLIKLGIKGPASTWTYQITDNPFSNDLGILLTNDRNIGFAVMGIVFLWPILLAKFIYTTIKNRK